MTLDKKEIALVEPRTTICTVDMNDNDKCEVYSSSPAINQQLYHGILAPKGFFITYTHNLGFNTCTVKHGVTLTFNLVCGNLLCE